MRIFLLALVSLAVGGPAPALAQKHDKGNDHATYPAHILIIRHAEKPPEPSSSVDLNAAGVARANALAQLFAGSAKRTDAFPKPDFIFATADTKHSHRPSETAAPLGSALGIKVDTRFGDGDVKPLARELLGRRTYEGKTVLVVWHQGTIPELAKALGADPPRGWKDSVFDRVWDITYDQHGKASLADRPQRLMRGDSER
jgi:broad specificity phosphatase PhoE